MGCITVNNILDGFSEFNNQKIKSLDELMKNSNLHQEQDLIKAFGEKELSENLIVVPFQHETRISISHPSLSGTSFIIHPTLDQAKYDFSNEIKKRVSYLINKGINVVLIKNIEWFFETASDYELRVLFTFQFKILKRDIYKYFFIDGVNSFSQNKACNYALKVVQAQIG